jgi:hypothetical protein
VEPGVTLVPPNGLADLGEPADRFTVIGAGKTAMDTCVWLLEAGVDPDRIPLDTTPRSVAVRPPFHAAAHLVGSVHAPSGALG